MSAIAVYNMKGGVGKTTISVNLAWSSAVQSARRTLLWDLDPQGAASFIIGKGKRGNGDALSVFSLETSPEDMIRKSRVAGLDLLAADTSLRGLDRLFFDISKKRRMARLIAALAKNYDRIIIDCPPGLNDISEQIMRGADLLIVPVIPSALAQRAFDEVVSFMAQKKNRHVPILPVLSMVDRRRTLHRQAVADNPRWPVIPNASIVEQMGTRQLPLGEFAPPSPATAAFTSLWRGIERKLDT